MIIARDKDAERRAAATVKAATLIEALPWLDRFHAAFHSDTVELDIYALVD